MKGGYKDNGEKAVDFLERNSLYPPFCEKFTPVSVESFI
jgi:hypothetical protein